MTKVHLDWLIDWFNWERNDQFLEGSISLELQQ